MSEYFQHPSAIVETQEIGKGSRIWAFVHILPGARIGNDCNICDHVFIENQVTLGDRVTVKCGVQLWDGVSIEDDVFIGPNATFTNDRFPRSKQFLAQYPETVIRKGASIGANATILPGLEVGPGAMVGAGSVVTVNIPAGAVAAGNPARIIGYGSTVGQGVKSEQTAAVASATDLKAHRSASEVAYRLDSLCEPNEQLSFLQVRVLAPAPARSELGEQAYPLLVCCIEGIAEIVVRYADFEQSHTLQEVGRVFRTMPGVQVSIRGLLTGSKVLTASFTLPV